MWEIKLKNVNLPEGYKTYSDEDFIYLKDRNNRIVSVYSSLSVSPIGNLIEQDAHDDYFSQRQHLYERNLRGDE